MTLTRRSSLAAMAAVGLALSSAAALAQEKEIRIGALMASAILKARAMRVWSLWTT